MKVSFTLASALLLAVCSTQLATARTMLLCNGYGLGSKGPVTHYIAIENGKADFDGKRFSVSESATEFVLTGPIPINDTIVRISRLTGEWYLNPSNDRDVARMEYSAAGEEGCRKADAKF